jgi:hypothetical protein
MANNQVCTAQAALRDVDNAPPCAAQDCSDVIHISVFFDGTNNNKEADYAIGKWSNVARIWRSAREFANVNPNANVYPIYISGVGTPFSGKEMFPGHEQVFIDLQDTDPLGGGVGTGGGRRLDYGQQQVNDALRAALLRSARTLDGKVASHAKAGKAQSFSEISRALGRHRLTRQINVSIFGFSRGAALARAFCNQWLWDCKEDRGKLAYGGIPIRFCFLGLFDTVASFGLPAANLANHPAFGGFQGRDLVVDERVERCVHYVAAHELRFSFPVDLIRKDGQLAGNWLETVYPGAHSDVGGGYSPSAAQAGNAAPAQDTSSDADDKDRPDDQGISNNYARIPMRDMMREALGAGARLFSYSDLNSDKYRALFQESFECRPETEAAYTAYCAACSPDGSVEDQVRRHMEQLYSAFGTLHRQGGESVTQRENRQGQSGYAWSPDDMGKELENYDKAVRDIRQAAQPSINPIANLANSAYIIKKGVYAISIAPQAWQRDAWKQTASDGAMSFIHGYVHDSKVGFMSNFEPFSYFSQRGIAESSRSVQGWFESSIARPVGRAFEDAVYYAAEKAQQAKEAARNAVSQGKQIAESAGSRIEAATQKTADGLNAAWEYLTQ